MGYRPQLAAAAVVFALSSMSVLAATAVLKGPPPRAITDPRSVVSSASPGAAPVPVAELYDVRGGSGAMWTPDGKTIVFSTNLTGRYNLWKGLGRQRFPAATHPVRRTPEWDVGLARRQKTFCSSPTTAAARFPICSSCRWRAAPSSISPIRPTCRRMRAISRPTARISRSTAVPRRRPWSTSLGWIWPRARSRC